MYENKSWVLYTTHKSPTGTCMPTLCLTWPLTLKCDLHPNLKTKPCTICPDSMFHQSVVSTFKLLQDQDLTFDLELWPWPWPRLANKTMCIIYKPICVYLSRSHQPVVRTFWVIARFDLWPSPVTLTLTKTCKQNHVHNLHIAIYQDPMFHQPVISTFWVIARSRFDLWPWAVTLTLTQS